MKRVEGAVLAVLALAGCRDENVETKLRAEPTPPPTVIAPDEPPVAKPRFVLVASGTPLRAEANESRITATLPEGGPPIVVFQVDAAQPDDSAWIRLRTSPRGSDCGYPAHVVSEPVHVRRDELVRTPRADKTIAGPKPTSIVLRRGLALRPLNDEGRFMVTTPEARSKLRLPEVELTTELDEAMLTAAADGTAGKAAPRADALRVGPHQVRLSKKRPPALSLLEGQPKLSQLITPCLRVTGVFVDEEKEKDRQVAVITSQLAALDVGLESVYDGSNGRPDLEALLDGPATGDLGRSPRRSR